MKKSIVIIAVLFALLAMPTTSSACSVPADWANRSDAENYQETEIVFVGTVTEVDRDEDINGYIYLSFDVDKAYKGPLGDHITIRAAGNSALCGYDDISMFTEGSVWAMYADNYLQTDSFSRNTEYDSVAQAIAAVDSFADNGNDIACADIYQPVCGLIDTGIRCVTTPCPSTEQKTFGNQCYMEREGGEFLYAGECKVATQPPVVPNDCKSWYDGCNWCGRSEVGGPMMCTQRACLASEVEDAYCSEYFLLLDKDVPPVVTPVEDDVQGVSGGGEIYDYEIPDIDIKDTSFLVKMWHGIVNILRNLF